MIPAILFVCRHNACRSQIAEALGRKLAPESWVIDSAGSHPSSAVDPKAVAILRRHNLGMHRRQPQGLPELEPRAWDFVVDISCERAGESVPANNYFCWDLADPLDGPMDVYKHLYDDIETRIRDLFRRIQAGRGIPGAAEPFRFHTRLHLTVLTGAKAKNLPELVDRLRALPDSVVYQHTHRFIQEHQSLVPEPPNDLASWVAHALGDEELAESLAAIDTVRFDTLQSLRGALVEALEAHFRSGGDCRPAPPGKEFHFTRAVKFSVRTPYESWDLPSFAECLGKVSISSLYLHIFEARLRPPLGANDFSLWLRSQLGEDTLAGKIADLDPYTHTLEGLRGSIMRLIAERLQEAPYAAS